ncbi:hypothetical protein AVEN_71098-1 [Araneus ventricosus]|uniref:Uncharacterized protein n=1 Tax=Araneus ventricosus TaxID=182803 RepID=A0A4Y2CAZ2_ARAVE|nr:hypothetical protein AVEN_71098-1 [Araneus ventricosus]
MPRHCENTLRSKVKCGDKSTTTAIIAVRQVEPFEVGRERAMLREEDNILSNPISVKETIRWSSDYFLFSEIEGTLIRNKVLFRQPCANSCRELAQWAGTRFLPNRFKQVNPAFR